MNFQALWKRVQEWLQDQGQPRHYIHKEKRKLKSLRRRKNKKLKLKTLKKMVIVQLKII
jgi:hypothetical protein